MSELADRAISGNDPQAFKVFRKLAACGAVLTTGCSGANAAALADNAIFQKKIEYAAGQGEISAEQAVEAMTDRKASTFVTWIRRAIKGTVYAGCTL